MPGDSESFKKRGEPAYGTIEHHRKLQGEEERESEQARGPQPRDLMRSPFAWISTLTGEREQQAEASKLVGELAPRLGLSASSVVVIHGEEGNAKVASHGAEAVAFANYIYLGKTVDLKTERGRRVVARELVNVARQTQPSGTQGIHDEQEAHQLGAVILAGGSAIPNDQLDPATVAKKGTQGPGERLPHLDRIQESFGGHDVSGVRAHVGGAAADATRQLGASGFAFGDHVAFASTPDLPTAAHEAAHHVQQRAGVALKGGIDHPGDEYERHADHVADAVVRGDSAVSLLDGVAGRGAGAAPARHTVQRKTGTSTTPTGPDPHAYVAQHRAALLNAIANRILDLGIPNPHEHLVWASHEEGARAIANGIRSYVEDAPADPLHRLATLITNTDLTEVVASVMRHSSDIATVGFTIASAFDHPVIESVQRIGTRIRARMDAQHKAADPSAAVTSNPLDRVVAQAMQGRVTGDALRTGQRAETRGKELANGAREVEYKWLGSKSPDMWNWIVATSPHDATAEDVATTPLAGGNSTGTEQAYRIAASPPYFGIPFETAKLVKEAIEYAPPAVRAQLDHDDGPRIAETTALAGNTASDSAAIAQVPKATSADLDPAHALERLELELSTAQRALTPWKVEHPIGAALAFVARRRAELARSPSRATQWAPVLAAQERAVNAAASDIVELTKNIPSTSANPHHPMTSTLAAYARAICVSHLASQALPALADARHMRDMLPLTIAEQQTAEVGSGVRIDPQVALDLATRAADFRAHAERGGKVDRAAVNALAADTQEATLDAQLGSLEHTLAELNAMADEAHITKSNYENNLPTVRLAGSVLSKRIVSWRQQLADAKLFKGPTAGHTADETIVEQRRKVMTQITTALVSSLAEIELEKYVEWARTTIHDRLVAQRIMKLVARLAGEIAIMVASMQIAGAAVAAVRGVMFGLEIADDVHSASLAVRIVTSVVAAGVQTVGQGAIGGEVSGKAFAENAVALGTMTAIMGPFEGLLAESSALEADLRTFAQKAVRSGSKLVMEAGAGYAGSVMGQATANGYVANAVGSDVLQQAFSLFVGKLVHQQTSAMTQRLDEAATVLGKQAVAAVRTKATQLAERALKGKPTNEEALALLRDRVALLREEKALYNGHPELESKIASAPSLGDDFVAVPLTLANLETVVEGHAYIGTRAEIDHAVLALEASGLHPHPLPDAEPGTHRYKIGERVIELRERAKTADVSAARDRSKPTEAQAARKSVIAKYKHLTAEDFAGADDPRLDEIAQAASAENEEVQARLRAALTRAGITDVEIQYRAKSLGSILGKLKETPGMKIGDIKDLSGIRVNILNVKESNFAQYDKIKAAIQQEFGIPDTAVKDYNKKPNPWGYTGRVHMFEVGGAEIVSEIQIGSKDLSAFIERKFSMPGGNTIELHDLTGYKGQLYGKAIPPDLQKDYTKLIGKITKVNEGGKNLADVPDAKAEVDAYFAQVQAFLDAP